MLVEIFEKSRFKSKFAKKNLDFGRNLQKKIAILVEIFENVAVGRKFRRKISVLDEISEKSRLWSKFLKNREFGWNFGENLDFGRNFLKPWFWSKISNIYISVEI